MSGTNLPSITDLPSGKIQLIANDLEPNTAFERFVVPALKGDGKVDLPKELFYKDQTSWRAIAKVSDQTHEEVKIIESSAKSICNDLPSGTIIIDLGAADSKKYEGYVDEMIRQKKKCTYVALDLSPKDLEKQVQRASDKYSSNDVTVVGLLGSFQDGDAYFLRVRGNEPARLFLSMGSIFFNAPHSMCIARCKAMASYFGPNDRLIVGQSAPGADANKVHAAYSTQAYNDGITKYLELINSIAGITESVEHAWTWESKLDDKMHYFQLTALKDLVGNKSGKDSVTVKKGQSFQLFKSWKCDGRYIAEVAGDEGLQVEELGREIVEAQQLNMRQFLIKPRPRA